MSAPQPSTYPHPSLQTPVTPEQRERFELSHLIAELISAENEPDGRPNSLFVLHMRETIYFSEMPTGTPEDWPD